MLKDSALIQIRSNVICSVSESLQSLFRVQQPGADTGAELKSAQNWSDLHKIKSLNYPMNQIILDNIIWVTNMNEYEPLFSIWIFLL